PRGIPRWPGRRNAGPNTLRRASRRCRNGPDRGSSFAPRRGGRAFPGFGNARARPPHSSLRMPRALRAPSPAPLARWRRVERPRAHPWSPTAAQVGTPPASLVELLLHLRQLHQRLRELPLIVLRRHRGALVLERIDLALQLLLANQQAALGGISSGSPGGAETNDDKARKRPAGTAGQRGGPERDRAPGLGKDRMLGREPLLGLVELRRLGGGVLECLQRADRIVLVGVRGGIAQRVDPVAREHGRVLLRTALGGGDDYSALVLQRGHRSAAGDGRVDDQLMAGRDLVAQLGERGRENVRAHEIELVLPSVVGAMADENEHELIVGGRMLRNRLQSLAQVSARGFIA